MDLWAVRSDRSDQTASRDDGGDGATPDGTPIALSVDGPHGPVVHGASDAALASGVQVGARVVDMRAALPDLVVHPGDAGGDADALERLARWSRRWCPWVAVDGLDGLVLDVTGAAHLFGGEAELLRDVHARLGAMGLRACAAVAPNRGAAWALARFGEPGAVCKDPRGLDPLPVQALRLDGGDVRTLKRLGLKTVGQLRAVPRASLRRRFGGGRKGADDGPLLRLDQAFGLVAEPVAPLGERPARRAVLRLPEPVTDPAPLVPDLCAMLAAQLKRQGEGCRRLRLTVCRTDGETRAVAAALARPTDDAAHMARLFRDRLADIDPGFGFDAAILDAPEAERLDAAQPDLSGAVDEAESLARLVDELSARLGPRAVTRPAFRDSHLPERAQSWHPVVDGMEADAPAAPRRDRPIVLLDPPEPVRVIYAVPEGPPVRMEWRRRPLTVARYAGPERIAPEWWAARPGTRLRDYYRVEDDGGRRYWLYREGVAGDGRGGAPSWFLHGLFP